MTNATRITDETIYEDGGYIATVRAYGFEFAAHYINGEIRLHGMNIPTSHFPGWKLDGSAKKARKAVADRLATLPTKWHDAHRKLYEEAA